MYITLTVPATTVVAEDKMKSLKESGGVIAKNSFCFNAIKDMNLGMVLGKIQVLFKQKAYCK